MVRSPLVRDLSVVLGPEGILSAPSELAVYECDAYTLERRPPLAVVFPRSTAEVAQVVRVCREHDCALVPRGAGTSLAGGCLPPSDGVVVMLTRMNRILGVQLRNVLALVEPGRAESRAHSGPGRHGLSFRARSVQPIERHDRRQRGDQRRRAAHAQVRRDGQSRAWPGGGPGRRFGGAARSGRRPGCPGPDRPVVRQRGDAGHRDQDLGPPDAGPARLSHACG